MAFSRLAGARLTALAALSTTMCAAPFPVALPAETRKIEFHVSTPRTKGSLETQTRAAIQELLRKNPRASIVKLRAFASGPHALATVGHVIERVFKHEKRPLPALALVGVAGFPETGQRVQVESTATTVAAVNPDGLAFLAGLASPAGERTIEGLAKVAREAAVAPENVLRISCFYESSGQVTSAKTSIARLFPRAESSFVWSFAPPDKPAIECEAVARLSTPVETRIQYFNPPGQPASPNFSRAALVSARRLVFTGMAAGSEAPDEIGAALERLHTAAESLGARLQDVAMAGNYWINAAARDRLREIRAKYYAGTVPAATGVFFTSLEQRATAGLELVLVAPDDIALTVGHALVDGTRRYKPHAAMMTQSLLKNNEIVQSRQFRMRKLVAQKEGVPVFRLLIDSLPGEHEPAFHSETVLNLTNMALLHREDRTDGGLHRVFDVDGAHVLGEEQLTPAAAPTRIDFANEIPSFYLPFLDATVNATEIQEGDVFRVATFDMTGRKTEWHTYRAASREEVAVGARKIRAWVIEERDQPRYTLRRIWLIQEPPYFPLDETNLRDGSIRRVEQTLLPRRG